MTYKVFQWASGNVGAHTARVSVQRESLELVGMHVYSDDKVGKDIGGLIGIDELGIPASNNMQTVLDSDADVVLHTPLPSKIYGENPDQDLDDICALLAAGKNVITIVGYMYPKVYGDAVVNRLEEACKAGNSTFHSSGLNPGWMGDLIPLVMSGLCERVDTMHVMEISCFDMYPSPEIMFDSMGFGATPDEFAVKNERQKIWLDGLFSESVQMVADGMGLGVTEIRSTLETELATEDLTVAAGVVKKGTVAGQHWRWSGMANGKETVVHETVWRMHPDVAPGWATGPNFIDFKGAPNMKLDIEGDFAFISDVFLATGMHAVNAIPHVIDAEPGIKTFLDLPWIYLQH
jgi:hypothetical protein